LRYCRLQRNVSHRQCRSWPTSAQRSGGTRDRSDDLGFRVDAAAWSARGIARPSTRLSDLKRQTRKLRTVTQQQVPKNVECNLAASSRYRARRAFLFCRTPNSACVAPRPPASRPTNAVAPAGAVIARASQLGLRSCRLSTSFTRFANFFLAPRVLFLRINLFPARRLAIVAHRFYAQERCFWQTGFP
jgi:hypothetical protein